MVIVDSTVWIDFFAGRQNAQTAWLKREIAEREFGLIDLILCEVLQGIATDAMFREVKKDLMEFEVFDSGGVALAVGASECYRFLRGKGVTVRKTIDCLIATFCIEEGHALLHRDRDFDGFEQYLGLRVIHP